MTSLAVIRFEQGTILDCTITTARVGVNLFGVGHLLVRVDRLQSQWVYVTKNCYEELIAFHYDEYGAHTGLAPEEVIRDYLKGKTCRVKVRHTTDTEGVERWHYYLERIIS